MTRLILLCLVGVSLAAEAVKKPRTAEDRLDAIEKTQQYQQTIISSLARQLSLQQLYVEEQARSAGCSGIKMVRLANTGTRPYHADKLTGSNRVAGVHNHNNYDRTIGLGEFVAVLNGVEFRTRHNDYKLRMPSRRSKDYGKTEDVPFPDVPNAVLNKPTLDAQIAEMREWFKAWQNEDYSKRDYRKFFKPTLCYLEGMWTTSNTKGAIDEPFASDRHSIDAKSFFDLQEKIKYTSVTGRKSRQENFAYLPTTISHLDAHGNPVFSQWNYNILCHPIKQHVPLSKIRAIDGIGERVARNKPFELSYTERYTRYSFWADADLKARNYDKFASIAKGSFLDKLMAEIPGKDNYPAKISDDAFFEMAVPTDAVIDFKNLSAITPLNAGYYHRAYKTARGDAMGQTTRFRGFNDGTLYVAYNTRDKVTPTEIQDCFVKNPKCNNYQARMKKCVRNECKTWKTKASYAIPLELIYMTPLLSWNPYNITVHADKNKPKKSMTDNKYTRNGGQSWKMAFAGAGMDTYYLTPEGFYQTVKPGKKDPADTVKGTMGVLDNKNQLRLVQASGTPIHTPPIPGLGAVRLRYPVMPLYEEGSAIWKEYEALKDMTLHHDKYFKLYPNVKAGENGTLEDIFTFELGTSKSDKVTPHIHTIELTTSQVEDLKYGRQKYITVTTSTDAGHDHELQIGYLKKLNYGPNAVFETLTVRRCDGGPWQCWDRHSSSWLYQAGRDNRNRFPAHL